MRNGHTLLRAALLGSAVALTGLTQVSAANLSRADWERVEAATGKHSPALQSGAGSLFSSKHTPVTYTVLHDFAGGTGDGQNSTAEVTLDSAGKLYGTTDYGGAHSEGVIFEIATDGTESLLHSFGGSGDGSEPDGAVTIESNGDMIGTASSGGSSENGVIWKLAADGTYTVLHNFTTAEGSAARGRLIQDRKGNFYGTALFGGANADGTVFKFNAKGRLTVLHTFGGSDGEFPEHGVVPDRAGNLYGVTAFGGASGEGTVYKIAADGTFTTLYSFTGGPDGGFLYGGLAIDKDGNLYGSTVSYGADGNGTVFRLAPDGTLTTLYSFTGGSDGGAPEGDMLLKGKALYSTATSGGAGGAGGVYEVKLTGREKMLQSFSTSGGDGYSAGLTASHGVFYGTTQYGATEENGVVFSLTKK